jgi:uncharacterized membrane protein
MRLIERAQKHDNLGLAKYLASTHAQYIEDMPAAPPAATQQVPGMGQVASGTPPTAPPTSRSHESEHGSTASNKDDIMQGLAERTKEQAVQSIVAEKSYGTYPTLLLFLRS